MDKDIIKKHLTVLKEESEPTGLTKTKRIQDESEKTNKAANKEVAKNMEELVKPLDSKNVSEPVKNELTSEEEDYHNEMEIRNGNEMIEYGNEPSKIFKERAEEAIAGSKRMGNANVDDNGTPLGNVVTADQSGFTGPKFGENLVKTIKASKKKRDDAETVRGPKTTVSGADIKDSSMSNKGSKSIALSENKESSKFSDKINSSGKELTLDTIYNEDKQKSWDDDAQAMIDYYKKNGKTATVIHKGNEHALYVEKAIKENKINKKNKMKRLVFKKEFKGIENALNVIPESYKVDGKEFHMTDGNEKYEIKWEGSLTEGRAVVLKASDKNLMTEDMAKMKHLMGYSSKETLGTVKGSARLDENAKFNDVLNKTKNLLNEGPVNGGMQGFATEGDLDEGRGEIDSSGDPELDAKIRKFFTLRFGRKPELNPSYYNEWVDRCKYNLESQMDNESLELWGKIKNEGSDISEEYNDEELERMKKNDTPEAVKQKFYQAISDEGLPHGEMFRLGSNTIDGTIAALEDDKFMRDVMSAYSKGHLKNINRISSGIPLMADISNMANRTDNPKVLKGLIKIMANSTFAR